MLYGFVLERLHMNIKPLYKRDLPSKARVPPLRENVATIELFWAPNHRHGPYRIPSREQPHR